MNAVVTPHTVAGAFWLTVGTGSARIMTIVVGVFFARQFDPSVYASYVAFIIACNLIAAIPLMGTTQLMLSERGSVGVANLLRQYMGTHLLLQLGCWGGVVVLTWLRLQGGNTQTDLMYLMSLYLFSLGYCLTGVTAAAYNKVGQRKRAGWCWIGATMTSTMSTVFGICSNMSSSQALLYLSIGWLVGGGLCVRCGLTQQTTHEGSVSAVTASPSLLQIVVFGAPSVIFLSGFYLLTQNSLHKGEAHLQGAFSLGYQLFSAALFLPGTMGNIITPRLVRLQQSVAHHRKFVLQILVAYALMATLWCGFVYLSMPVLLDVFQLSREPEAVRLILWFQVAAAIAMLQACLNQLMASDRMARHILLAACAWVLVTLIFPNHANHVTQSAAHALVLAYLVCLAYSTLALRLFRPSMSKS